MLTVDQIASELGVDPRTVLAWIARDELPAINVAAVTGPTSRPKWRVTRAAVAAFLDSRTKKPATRRPRRGRSKPVRRFV